MTWNDFILKAEDIVKRNRDRHIYITEEEVDEILREEDYLEELCEIDGGRLFHDILDACEGIKRGIHGKDFEL